MSAISAETKTKIYRAIARGEADGRIINWWGLTETSLAAFKANLTRNKKLAK